MVEDVDRSSRVPHAHAIRCGSVSAKDPELRATGSRHPLALGVDRVVRSCRPCRAILRVTNGLTSRGRERQLAGRGEHVSRRTDHRARPPARGR